MVGGLPQAGLVVAVVCVWGGVILVPAEVKLYHSGGCHRIPP
jgi:hypothetical protein